MKKNKITACPACGAKATTKQVGVYQVCFVCHMMYLHQLPDTMTLAKQIENDGEWIISDGDNIDVLQVHKDRFKMLKKFIKPKSSMLDVGCGKGQFLHFAKSKGYTVVAIDMSKTIVSYVKKSLGIPAYTNINSIKKKFDVVTAFDVIEHTRYPNAFVKSLHKKLNPKGILMITTPNAKGISGFFLGKRWWAFGPEAHFNLFNPDALRVVLEKNGFAILHMTTDTLTQWLPANKKIWEILVNKVIYILFMPIKNVAYSNLLGDNIEVIARKL